MIGALVSSSTSLQDHCSQSNSTCSCLNPLPLCRRMQSASILREMLLEHVGDLTLEQAQQHKATRTVCGRCGKR